MLTVELKPRCTLFFPHVAKNFCLFEVTLLKFFFDMLKKVDFTIVGIYEGK